MIFEVCMHLTDELCGEYFHELVYQDCFGEQSSALVFFFFAQMFFFSALFKYIHLTRLHIFYAVPGPAIDPAHP